MSIYSPVSGQKPEQLVPSGPESATAGLASHDIKVTAAMGLVMVGLTLHVLL